MTYYEVYQMMTSFDPLAAIMLVVACLVIWHCILD